MTVTGSSYSLMWARNVLTLMSFMPCYFSSLASFRKYGAQAWP
jgi:hypothetical protein